ncbi:unnamed protein product [Larinioides sclopetarius]|uniref:Uncharacterized protein n=1 Tax=Larinioides sclopetarius TaxID=280406 RepID=A0AAV2BQZ8_9ARAC
MACRHSSLLAFLQSALIENKYRNLKYEDESRLIFSINLPHISRILGDEFDDTFTEKRNLEGNLERTARNNDAA